jgi:apolipoprotein N-acyltransferase
VPAAVGAVLVVAAVATGALAPQGEPTGESITVAYVQGGGEQGTTDEETDDREVFLTHLRATEQVPVGTDLTVWPENVVNVDGPIESVREGRELAAIAREKQTTLVAGVVEGIEDDDEHFYNASVVFGPDGEIIGRYDKVRRVPFGEFVPFRGLLEQVAGGALPSKDAIAGTETNTVDTPAGRVGIVISWEVFFGDRARDAVNGRGRPAELLLNPTNGSSYSGTLVQSQQIGNSRLRAIETGRWTVQAAPTGFSAFVTDDGEVLDRSGVSEQRVEVREVPLREGRTLWLRFGAWPPFLLAVALIVAANVGDRLARRRRAAPGPDPASDPDPALATTS